MAQRAKREIEELVEALERHVRLLKEYAHKAFRDGNTDYGGEIAGKLRLLVTSIGKSNRPLLIDLMEKTGIKPLIKLGGPPIQRPPGEPRAGDMITLSGYLELTAIGIELPSGDFVTLNKIKFIRAWAEQTGSSHEDWSLDPELTAILRSGIHIGGVDAAFAELKVTTETVLWVATQFLAQFKASQGGPTTNRK
jgi:hypothetical protein